MLRCWSTRASSTSRPCATTSTGSTTCSPTWRLDGRAAAEESGIDADAIRDLARTIAGAERCTIAWTMGVNHSVQGTETVTLINTLALLTGNIGRPGASPFSITGQCNAMGTRETGFTASMPGYRAYDDPAARRAGRRCGASTRPGCPRRAARPTPTSSTP